MILNVRRTFWHQDQREKNNQTLIAMAQGNNGMIYIAKIEGPAAHDILTNFEQRWRKATKWQDFILRKVTHWNDDALIKIERISWIITPFSDKSNTIVSDERDPENWHVQIFWSIDSGSVKGFPKLIQEVESKNLVCAKNLKIDKSIHSAYVKAIRSAQHFIYIENQYFIGSSYNWPSYKNAGADNLIPMEGTRR